MSTVVRPRLCLIEDDEIVGEALADRFELEGYACDWFRTGEEALLEMPRRHYDLVLSDIHLPDVSGEALYETLSRKMAPLPPYLFITGYGEIDQAVRLLKLGATDYITKPFDIATLLQKIRSLTGAIAAEGAAAQLGVSPSMRQLETTLVKLGSTSGNVLITGEQGVGKERLAFTLHRQRYQDGSRPFIALNCGAFAEDALEAELFGREKPGSGNSGRLRKGAFELADGGTLFLDEVGDVPPSLQGKLLRAIQERTVVRMGGETRIPVDLRIVCATQQNLKKLVERGEFREDLYYYINVVRLHVPPLRERKEDILWLAQRFLDEQAGQRRSGAMSLSVRAERLMLDYPWPGNVRELKSAIERACLLGTQGALQPEALFEELPQSLDTTSETLDEHLKIFERQYIMRVLATHEGHGRITRAAVTLGISRKNLWERMKRLGIAPGGEG
ncbi:MAG: transcriptional regulator [Betaproteobacteria bacterium RIFCSPLOWO2_12_FULL_62_13]|nr:MAG: transcriptional regulator [Betaproteobacteria bacterium RIFCSPLOWO2_12_FULL_62_13]